MVSNYSLPNPLTVNGNNNYTLPNPLTINDNENNNVPKSKLIAEVIEKRNESIHAIYKNAAVASDHSICSEIGRDILLAGGNAVDSAIATLIGIGIVNPQSSGIGGSCLMTIYNASTKKAFSIDARGTAPAASNSTMFVGKSEDAVLGWKAVVVPGEIHGFWTAFKQLGSGRISWKSIFEPSIKLARNGFPVSNSLALVLKQKEVDILADEHMSKQFINPLTGNLYEEGEIIKRKKLANTLELIANAEDPVKLFYQDGSIAETIAKEFKEQGGIITSEDLSNFETIVHDTPLQSTLALNGSNLVMCGPPPPSSFGITSAIVGIMAEFYNAKQDNASYILDDTKVYHRLIEAQKFAYSYRTKFADPIFSKEALEVSQRMMKSEFIKGIASKIPDVAKPLSYYNTDPTVAPESHGTSHVSVLDAEGNAVSATTTVNLLLGSKKMSPELGIIWNNLMDDFSTPGQPNAFGFPPSAANFIEPGKRPLSAMAPTIIYNKDDGKVKMVVGGSGGSRIISAVAQTIIRSQIFHQNVKESVDAPRLHNQFIPNITEYETTIPSKIIDKLESEYLQTFTPITIQESVVQAITVENDGLIHANSDFRRRTSANPAGY
uniref:Gamma-glutamyltransferase n=1 Tax=Panagrolaimus sp. ES5 TaxID=591445 RepID=A0AC34F8W7_9BILA